MSWRCQRDKDDHHGGEKLIHTRTPRPSHLLRSRLQHTSAEHPGGVLVRELRPTGFPGDLPPPEAPGECRRDGRCGHPPLGRIAAPRERRHVRARSCTERTRRFRNVMASANERSRTVGISIDVLRYRPCLSRRHAFRPGHQVCVAARSAVGVCGATPRATRRPAKRGAPGSEPLPQPRASQFAAASAQRAGAAGGTGGELSPDGHDRNPPRIPRRSTRRSRVLSDRLAPTSARMSDQARVAEYSS